MLAEGSACRSGNSLLVTAWRGPAGYGGAFSFWIFGVLDVGGARLREAPVPLKHGRTWWGWLGCGSVVARLLCSDWGTAG